MLYTIYQVTHRESGKYYIGKHQTMNVNDGYMGSGRKIINAISKYGVDAFDKTVLHIFNTEEEMNAKEAELVTEEFCSREDTYNLCPGGQGGWGYINQEGLNRNYTPDRNKKISNTLKTKGFIPKTAGNGNAAFVKASKTSFQGRKHKESSIQKMKETLKGTRDGELNSQFGSIWITNGTINKKIKGSIPDGWNRGRTTMTTFRQQSQR